MPPERKWLYPIHLIAVAYLVSGSTMTGLVLLGVQALLVATDVVTFAVLRRRQAPSVEGELADHHG